MPSVYDEEPGGGGGKFLKIESGKTVRIRLVQDPIKFTKVYNEQASTRYASLVLHRDETDKTTRLAFYEMPASVFRLVRDLVLSEDWGNSADYQEGYDLRIKREGAGMETRYSVAPVPKKPLSSSDLALLKEERDNFSVEKAFKLGDPADDWNEGRPAPTDSDDPWDD